MKRQLVNVTSGMILVLIAVQLAACNSAAPPEQEGRGKSQVNPLDAGSLGFFSALFQAYRIIATYPHIQQVTDIADAAFWDMDSSSSIAGGIVTLNGTLVEHNTYPNGSSYHNSYNARYDNVNTVGLRFDGSYHVFEAKGNSYFGPLCDSLRSPTADVDILSPRVTDTISRSAGVTIRWTPGNAQIARILLIDTVKAEHTVFGREVPDNGTYTIAPADMQSLAPGPVILEVEHGNFKEGKSSDGRTYYIVVHAAQDLHMFMKP